MFTAIFDQLNLSWLFKRFFLHEWPKTCMLSKVLILYIIFMFYCKLSKKNAYTFQFYKKINTNKENKF